MKIFHYYVSLNNKCVTLNFTWASTLARCKAGTTTIVISFRRGISARVSIGTSTGANSQITQLGVMAARADLSNLTMRAHFYWHWFCKKSCLTEIKLMIYKICLRDVVGGGGGGGGVGGGAIVVVDGGVQKLIHSDCESKLFPFPWHPWKENCWHDFVLSL